MTTERIDEVDPKKHEEALIAAIPKDGSGKGNTALIQELRWDPDLYWEIRDRLIDQGLIERARGRGGSVRWVTKVEPAAEEQVANEPIAVPEPEPRIKEDQLYEPLAIVIADSWAKDKRYEEFHVEITARQGKRDTGGKWTRPDIVLVSYSSFLFVPGKHLDITTFEVKPYDGLDVTAVYEALAHRRFGTRAYVLIHVPPEKLDGASGILEIVHQEARRHGVGMIVTTEPGEYGEWDDWTEAIRQELDPHQANEFLSKQVGDPAKDKLMRWSR